jgi:hypothetical protein
MKVRIINVTKLPPKGVDLRSYTDARQLVDWLNTEQPIWAKEYKMPEEQALYLRDLRLFKRHQKKAQRATEILKEINAVVATEGTLPWPQRAKQLSDELGRLIRPLQWLRWRFGVEKGRWYLDQTWRGDADYGLLLVARLSKHGLDWVRRCCCGKWFLAYSIRNRFHSATCRAAFWIEQVKTPEGRESRKLYMQKLRALKKVLKSRKQGKRKAERRRLDDEKTQR